jgi:hypothetical protein
MTVKVEVGENGAEGAGAAGKWHRKLTPVHLLDEPLDSYRTGIDSMQSNACMLRMFFIFA